MQFTAKIKRNSAVWRNWTNLRRLTAFLGNVSFRKLPNGDFVSVGVLAPNDVADLQHHIAVQLEAATLPPKKPVVEKQAEPKPAPEKQPSVAEKLPEVKPVSEKPVDFSYRARREARLKARGA